MLVAVAALSAPVGAQVPEFFSVPIDQVVRGAEGDVIEVAAIDVPEEQIGATCTVVGETEN